MSTHTIGDEIQPPFRVSEEAILIVTTLVPGVSVSEAYCYLGIDDRPVLDR
ncbi:hypothetical protein [Halioglobus maricola]|uniref:hypothetical protein n=1 Tax=Halioglobus maricola TaxID=2601894 RepID=UPI00147845A6|nr:hypothetical protein [Halioglobus maricola]